MDIPFPSWSFRDIKIAHKNAGKVSKNSFTSFSRKLLPLSSEAAQVCTAQQKANDILRDINKWPEDVPSQEFITIVRGAILELHKYNLQTFMVSKNPVQELKALKVKYIELECDYLYSTNYHKDKRRERRVHRRVWQFLNSTSNEAMNGTDGSFWVPNKEHSKTILELLGSARPKCGFRNNLIESFIKRLIEELKLTSEINQLMNTGIACATDPFFDTPLTKKVRDSLTPKPPKLDESIRENGDDNRDDNKDEYQIGDGKLLGSRFQPSKKYKRLNHQPLVAVKNEIRDAIVCTSVNNYPTSFSTNDTNKGNFEICPGVVNSAQNGDNIGAPGNVTNSIGIGNTTSSSLVKNTPISLNSNPFNRHHGLQDNLNSKSFKQNVDSKIRTNEILEIIEILDDGDDDDSNVMGAIQIKVEQNDTNVVTNFQSGVPNPNVQNSDNPDNTSTRSNSASGFDCPKSNSKEPEEETVEIIPVAANEDVSTDIDGVAKVKALQNSSQSFQFKHLGTLSAIQDVSASSETRLEVQGEISEMSVELVSDPSKEDVQLSQIGEAADIEGVVENNSPKGVMENITTEIVEVDSLNQKGDSGPNNIDSVKIIDSGKVTDAIVDDQSSDQLHDSSNLIESSIVSGEDKGTSPRAQERSTLLTVEISVDDKVDENVETSPQDLPIAENDVTSGKKQLAPCMETINGEMVPSEDISKQNVPATEESCNELPSPGNSDVQTIKDKENSLDDVTQVENATTEESCTELVPPPNPSDDNETSVTELSTEPREEIVLLENVTETQKLVASSNDNAASTTEISAEQCREIVIDEKPVEVAIENITAATDGTCEEFVPPQERSDSNESSTAELVVVEESVDNETQMLLASTNESCTQDQSAEMSDDKAITTEASAEETLEPLKETVSVEETSTETVAQEEPAFLSVLDENVTEIPEENIEICLETVPAGVNDTEVNDGDFVKPVCSVEESDANVRSSTSVESCPEDVTVLPEVVSEEVVTSDPNTSFTDNEQPQEEAESETCPSVEPAQSEEEKGEQSGSAQSDAEQLEPVSQAIDQSAKNASVVEDFEIMDVQNKEKTTAPPIANDQPFSGPSVDFTPNDFIPKSSIPPTNKVYDPDHRRAVDPNTSDDSNDSCKLLIDLGRESSKEKDHKIAPSSLIETVKESDPPKTDEINLIFDESTMDELLTFNMTKEVISADEKCTDFLQDAIENLSLGNLRRASTSGERQNSTQTPTEHTIEKILNIATTCTEAPIDLSLQKTQDSNVEATPDEIHGSDIPVKDAELLLALSTPKSNRKKSNAKNVDNLDKRFLSKAALKSYDEDKSKAIHGMKTRSRTSPETETLLPTGKKQGSGSVDLETSKLIVNAAKPDKVVPEEPDRQGANLAEIPTSRPVIEVVDSSEFEKDRSEPSESVDETVKDIPEPSEEVNISLEITTTNEVSARKQKTKYRRLESPEVSIGKLRNRRSSYRLSDKDQSKQEEDEPLHKSENQEPRAKLRSRVGRSTRLSDEKESVLSNNSSRNNSVDKFPRKDDTSGEKLENEHLEPDLNDTQTVHKTRSSDKPDMPGRTRSSEKANEEVSLKNKDNSSRRKSINSKPKEKESPLAAAARNRRSNSDTGTSNASKANRPYSKKPSKSPEKQTSSSTDLTPAEDNSIKKTRTLSDNNGSIKDIRKVGTVSDVSVDPSQDNEDDPDTSPSSDKVPQSVTLPNDVSKDKTSEDHVKDLERASDVNNPVYDNKKRLAGKDTTITESGSSGEINPGTLNGPELSSHIDEATKENTEETSVKRPKKIPAPNKNGLFKNEKKTVSSSEDPFREKDAMSKSSTYNNNVETLSVVPKLFEKPTKHPVVAKKVNDQVKLNPNSLSRSRASLDNLIQKTKKRVHVETIPVKEDIEPEDVETKTSGIGTPEEENNDKVSPIISKDNNKDSANRKTDSLKVVERIDSSEASHQSKETETLDIVDVSQPVAEIISVVGLKICKEPEKTHVQLGQVNKNSSQEPTTGERIDSEASDQRKETEKLDVVDVAKPVEEIISTVGLKMRREPEKIDVQLEQVNKNSPHKPTTDHFEHPQKESNVPDQVESVDISPKKFENVKLCTDVSSKNKRSLDDVIQKAHERVDVETNAITNVKPMSPKRKSENTTIDFNLPPKKRRTSEELEVITRQSHVGAISPEIEIGNSGIVTTDSPKIPINENIKERKVGDPVHQNVQPITEIFNAMSLIEQRATDKEGVNQKGQFTPPVSLPNEELPQDQTSASIPKSGTGSVDLSQKKPDPNVNQVVSNFGNPSAKQMEPFATKEQTLKVATVITESRIDGETPADSSVPIENQVAEEPYPRNKVCISETISPAFEDLQEVSADSVKTDTSEEDLIDSPKSLELIPSPVENNYATINFPAVVQDREHDYTIGGPLLNETKQDRNILPVLTNTANITEDYQPSDFWLQESNLTDESLGDNGLQDLFEDSRKDDIKFDEIEKGIKVLNMLGESPQLKQSKVQTFQEDIEFKTDPILRLESAADFAFSAIESLKNLSEVDMIFAEQPNLAQDQPPGPADHVEDLEPAIINGYQIEPYSSAIAVTENVIVERIAQETHTLPTNMLTKEIVHAQVPRTVTGPPQNASKPTGPSKKIPDPVSKEILSVPVRVNSRTRVVTTKRDQGPPPTDTQQNKVSPIQGSEAIKGKIQVKRNLFLDPPKEAGAFTTLKNSSKTTTIGSTKRPRYDESGKDYVFNTAFNPHPGAPEPKQPEDHSFAAKKVKLGESSDERKVADDGPTTKLDASINKKTPPVAPVRTNADKLFDELINGQKSKTSPQIKNDQNKNYRTPMTSKSPLQHDKAPILSQPPNISKHDLGKTYQAIAKGKMISPGNSGDSQKSLPKTPRKIGNYSVSICGKILTGINGSAYQKQDTFDKKAGGPNNSHPATKSGVGANTPREHVYVKDPKSVLVEENRKKTEFDWNKVDSLFGPAPNVFPVEK